MRIHLVTVGQRPPAWVAQGYADYARRLAAGTQLRLVEIPLAKRGRHADLARLREQEGERMLAAIPKGSRVIALEVTGRAWDSETLAGRLADWLQDGRDVCLLVGGPDGLAPACLKRAEARWSLSSLTLPHALVRVIVAEQIYRAWTIVQGHPYHRG